jgi:hypothetical protein
MLLLAAAFAAEPTLDAAVGLSYWRLGLNVGVRPGLVIDMPWQQEGSVLMGSAALKPQLDVTASPAQARVGGRLRFEPIAMLDITPYAYGTAYFGNFQTVVGYDDWDVNYGDNDAIATYIEEDPTRQATGKGVHAGINGTIKAKAGPVIVLANGDIGRWWVQSAATEQNPYFFEREYEVMMRAGQTGGDTMFMLNGLVLYELDRDTEDDKYLRAGSITTWRRTFTADDEVLRTGVLVTATKGKLTHVVLVQPYLRDRAFETVMPPFTAYQLKFAL